ncbi:hypothetical protein SAMN05421841_1214 [Chryseobacterium wanjuense]|uniref:Uncharacterized protein n=1 Tax=Chryseobacterium wanjuense TaxID=356305 RepID=A0A1I0PGV5_9FLAO|nr:hypothetical protein SAMN05421841_1214 [Chryseobacterium wanjuense]
MKLRKKIKSPEKYRAFVLYFFNENDTNIFKNKSIKLL